VEEVMVDIASCSVNPSSIELGGSSTLTVGITSPAPAGGITVLVDADFGNGSVDTLQDAPGGQPISLGVQEGQTGVSFPLQTAVVENAAVTIIFSAHVGFSTLRKSATLSIGQ
jgi:hypothetical protein